MRSLQDYLTIRQAAEIIGVSPSTLRAWDRAGKLRAARNPMNRYRLYRCEDIEALLARIAKPVPSAREGTADLSRAKPREGRRTR